MGQRRQLIEEVEKFAPHLHRIAVAWGCDFELASDISQETLTVALEKLDQLRNKKSLQSWLVAILSNCYRQQLRKSHSLVDIDDVELVDEDTPYGELRKERNITQVKQAIALLNDDQRQVLTLVDMEGFSYSEVASALEIRIGTVMSRLCRARARLRSLLHDVLSQDYNESSAPHLRRVK